MCKSKWGTSFIVFWGPQCFGVTWNNKLIKVGFTRNARTTPHHNFGMYLLFRDKILLKMGREWEWIYNPGMKDEIHIPFETVARFGLDLLKVTFMRFLPWDSSPLHGPPFGEYVLSCFFFQSP